MSTNLNTMKRLLFTLILFAGSFANAQDTTYSKIYENLEFSAGQVIAAAVTLDGGLITTSENMSGFGGVEILRTLPDGTILWEKSIHGLIQNGFFVNDIIATSDTGYVLSGIAMDISSDFYPFCLKLNDQGDAIWNQTFDFTTLIAGNYDLLLKENPYIAETSDSSIIMAWHHSTHISFNTPDHLCVTKLSSDGNLLWSNSMLVDSLFYVTDIVENHDQSIFVLGNTDDQYGSGYVVHLTEFGVFDWAKKYDDVVFDEIIVDSNGFAVSWMNLTQDVTGVMKFDSLGVNTKRIFYNDWISEVHPSFDRRDNGNYVFSQRGDNYGGGSLLEVNDTLGLVNIYSVMMVLQTVRSIPNSGVYLVGYGPMYGVKSDYNQIGVLRYDSLMMSDSWCSWPEFNDIQIDSTITGQSTVFTSMNSISMSLPSFSGGPTFSAVEDGCVTFFGSVDEIDGTWNETISPNPSSGEFTIEWLEYRDAELVIYNSIGTEVYRTNAKDSFVEIDLGAEQNGVYYYRLSDENGSQSNGKLVLMK